jgi:hypothetical protein
MNPVPLRRYLRFIPRLPRRNPRPPAFICLIHQQTNPMLPGSDGFRKRPSFRRVRHVASQRPEGGQPSILRRYRAYLPRPPRLFPIPRPPFFSSPRTSGWTLTVVERARIPRPMRVVFPLPLPCTPVPTRLVPPAASIQITRRFPNLCGKLRRLHPCSHR